MNNRIKIYLLVFYGYFIIANFVSYPWIMFGMKIPGMMVILYAIVSIPVYFLALPVIQGFYLFNIVPLVLLVVKVIVFRNKANGLFVKLLAVYLFSLIFGYMAYNQALLNNS